MKKWEFLEKMSVCEWMGEWMNEWMKNNCIPLIPGRSHKGIDWNF